MDNEKPQPQQQLLALWDTPEILVWNTQEEAEQLVGTRVLMSKLARDSYGDQSDNDAGAIIDTTRNGAHIWVEVEWRNGYKYCYRNGDLIKRP